MTKKWVDGIITDMTAEEQALYDADDARITQKEADLEAAKENKLANQSSGNQKLLDLGLTQAEATALTGYIPPEED